MAIKYKKLCGRCKKNYVVVGWRQRTSTCYDCIKSELSKEITDPKMKKLFDVPEEYLKKNTFLRNVKLSYIRYGKLSDKQIEAFQKTVNEYADKSPVKQ